jgi:hypothetical protein
MRAPARGTPRRAQKRMRSMSDTQETTIARLQERLEALKERL